MSTPPPGDHTPHTDDLTVPPKHGEVRKAFEEEPQESAAATANLQTRIPAWMPHVRTMPPPEAGTAGDSAADSVMADTELIPAQRAAPPVEEPAPSAPPPEIRTGRRLRARLPLTAAICVLAIALIALVLAATEMSGSPKGPSPLAIPSASVPSQGPTASRSDAAGASCAAGQSSSCTATPDASAATGSATPSSASPSAQGTSAAPEAGSSGGASPLVGAQPGASNLALNRTVTASGYTQTYAPANAVDGNTSSYWESTDNAFPQWFRIDLGSVTAIGALVIDLPPLSTWPTRTQTIQVQGSANGVVYSTIEPSTGYTFNPATGNTVTIDLPAGASARYLLLDFSTNTTWPAGQMSELEVFG
jgi:hypothetical protein